MSTLEETFLPDEFGRANGHISDSDEQSDYDEEAGMGLPPAMTGETPQQFPGGQSQTGPKGVLADYKQFCRERDQDKRVKDAQLIEMAKRMTLSKAESDSDDDFLDDDEEYMQQYRQRRIDEMKHIMNARPKFGSLRTVTSESYLQEIDGEDVNVFVVVHLYKQSLHECQKMNEILEQLAARYSYVKFLKAEAHRLSQKFSSGAGLPAILVYQGGDLQVNQVAVVDTIGSDFVIADVEELLANNGIIIERKSVNNITDFRDDE
ncbi:hypothetical protein SARC_05654 [Sphaeroforma arctica JP610]|uniref:Phosducin domain-containing protein n=1 Tax=Sphaeroforma arctica JP610 TaxID=667725 RepID=A0A0L0FZT7_9EUKA|nr:hypothetical protein SARC_05654 [Sphaeroforma arctica JP610]KNC82061.1 hypothetical protein SARC_05654 [Sphaeroforma arctica JP610]|eukprot:XP_014155963.1 hypothetical protein SARC_05654 [Sphaeroforma arctica JP610]